MNLTEVKNILEKGGLVRLPEWPKNLALRGFLKPRLVKALRTAATGTPYLIEQDAWPQLHEQPYATRRDWEMIRDDTLKQHAVDAG